MGLMIKFAAAPGEITMLTEILRERHPILVLRQVAKPVQIAIDAGRRRTKPHHDRSTRRAAERSSAMGLLEEDSLASQFVDVGSLCLWMSAEATNPIVQIVDSDEQDVRPVDRVGGIGPLVR